MPQRERQKIAFVYALPENFMILIHTEQLPSILFFTAESYRTFNFKLVMYICVVLVQTLNKFMLRFLNKAK